MQLYHVCVWVCVCVCGCVGVCVCVCVYHINSDIYKFTKFRHLCELGGF